MDSLQTLLQQQPREPEEIRALKRYIADEFQASVSITIQPQAVIITVPSASLANTLRLRTVALQQIANTTKRLKFRIG